MRLLVCGSAPRRRAGAPGWTSRRLLEEVLDRVVFDAIAAGGPAPTLVEGGAEGADRMGRAWAERHGFDVETHEADWSRGPGAGPARNRAMLATGIDQVFAFSTSWPATPGTADMCRIAVDAGVPVLFVTPDGTERAFHAPVLPLA